MKCIFCAQSGGFTLKFDRKSRPYFSCSLCGHRQFIRTKRAFALVLAWSKALASLNSQELEIQRRAAENLFFEVLEREPKVKEWHETEKEKEITLERSQ